MSASYDKALPKRWEGLAEVFTALGDEHRQKILLMFGRGAERTITEIVDQVPLSRTAVTHHLNVLRDAGVLQAERRGKEVYLKPDPKRILEAIDGVRSYIKEEFRQ